MNREKNYLQLLLEMTKAITSNLNLNEVFDLIVHKVPEVVGVDAASDPRIHTIYHKEAKAEGVGSILAVPITVREEPIGMMRLLTAEVRYFSAADINFAMAVAEQGGIAIQNAVAYQKLQGMLSTPSKPSTGASN
jgi:GAF domain-containing protein